MQQQWELLIAANLGWVMSSVFQKRSGITPEQQMERYVHVQRVKTLTHANTRTFKSYTNIYSWTHQVQTKLTLTDRWGPIHLQPLSESAGQNLTAHQGEARQARVPDNVPCEVIYTSSETNNRKQKKNTFVHPPTHPHTNKQTNTHTYTQPRQ